MKHDMAWPGRVDGSAQFVISGTLVCHVRLLALAIATTAICLRSLRSNCIVKLIICELYKLSVVGMLNASTPTN